MLRRCQCGNVFDPEQIIYVRALGGNPQPVKTTGSCVFCFKEWAEKYSRLCVVCKQAFSPNQAIGKIDPPYVKKSGLAHLFRCIGDVQSFVSYWTEEGKLISYDEAKRQEAEYIEKERLVEKS